MSCSINIIRRKRPVHEVKYVPIKIKNALIQRDAEKELLEEVES